MKEKKKKVTKGRGGYWQSAKALATRRARRSVNKRNIFLPKQKKILGKKRFFWAEIQSIPLIVSSVIVPNWI